MSIYFEFNVEEERRFRRAVDQDKTDIEEFWDPKETETLFNVGVTDVGALIELSSLSICMIDKEKYVLGFLALNDYPPIPSVDPASWESWVRNLFKKYYLSRNTLFIHLISCMDSVSEFFLEEALTSVFMNDSYLNDIILVVPPTCKIDCLEKYPLFKKRPALRRCSAGSEKESCMYLLVATRQDFIPALKVRRAVEEDNDEIVEILDKKCTKLKEMYGSYYISEIIARHPESNRKVIVAEFMDKVVGVMCMNPDVNYEKLQHMYELGAFHGLVLPKPLERERMKRTNVLLKEFGDPIMLGEFSPFDKFEDKPETRTSFSSRRPSIATEKCRARSTSSGKVIFRSDRKRHSHSADTGQASHMTSQESEKLYSSFMSLYDPSLLLLLDEDPFDYDIVNINPSFIFNVRDMSFNNEFEGRKSTLKPDPIKEDTSRRKRVSMSETFQGLLYEGTPNAFCIELFGIDTDIIDERRAYDLLQAAFESLPNYEYCIIRIPTAQKSFPLLHHFCFVPTKPHVCCQYALYVAHRNSVLGKMRVRQAEFADIPSIARFLRKMDARETIYTIEQSIAKTSQQWVFVFLTGIYIVGFAILDYPENIDMIRAKFVIDMFERPKYHLSGVGLDGGFSMLKTVLVYPAFEPHYAFFCRELMRMTATTTLVWLTGYKNKWVAHKANGLVAAMTPVPYRVNTDDCAGPSVPNLPKNNKVSFSTWFISKKLSSISKLNVDMRIVIVGASRTAIAFLITLLFGQTSTYLTFTNVTLVSPHGLSVSRDHNPSAELMFPRFYATSARFLKSTPFQYFVNIVHGTMVAINKQDKYITIDNGGKVFYDRLLLLIGRQHQHPQYMRSMTLREREIKRGKIPTYVGMDNPQYIETQREPRTDYLTPENVFIINDMFDANRALNLLKSCVTQGLRVTVCVYGSCTSAYCCLSALLDDGVDPEDIVFVESFPPEDDTKSRIPVFCNTKVDETVGEYLKTMKIAVHRGYYFHGWTLDDEDLVYSVEFLSHYHLLKIDCDAFFYFGKRYINAQAFVAINRCGLAYDGGILIDHHFRTNNPSIFAAGPASRYYRRYDSGYKLQKFYDSEEIGTILAKQIRNELDPLFTESEKCFDTTYCKKRKKVDSDGKHKSEGDDSSASESAENDESSHKMWLLPKFHKPLVYYCTLPGELQYLEVRPPGAMFPHYYVQSLEYKGSIIETVKNGYFKLHLSKDMIIDGITCLTPLKNSIQKLQVLYGLSAGMLNNVHFRYQTCRIDDLYAFFEEPWSVYLYNEQADVVLSMVKHLKPKNNPDGKTLDETMHILSTAIKGGKKNFKAALRKLSSSKKSEYFEVIADFVIDWLSDNEILFPMYITPQYLGEYTHDQGWQRIFKRRKRNLKHNIMSSIVHFNNWHIK